MEFNGTIGGRLPEWEAPHYTTSLDAAVTLYEERPDRIPATPMEVCLEAVALRLGRPLGPPEHPSDAYIHWSDRSDAKRVAAIRAAWDKLAQRDEAALRLIIAAVRDCDSAEQAELDAGEDI